MGRFAFDPRIQSHNSLPYKKFRYNCIKKEKKKVKEKSQNYAGESMFPNQPEPMVGYFGHV